MKRADGAAFVATLGALLAVTATAVDIMMPAQPSIARAFNLPESAGAAMVGTFSIGYGFGQMMWGPLSDRFGRLPVLYIALSGFIIAGIVCAVAGSFTTLLTARFFHGFMGGAGPTLARAIARDLGGGQKTAQALSAATIFLGGAPLLAPLGASGLLVIGDWRWIFWALVIFGTVVTASALLFVPETHPLEKRATPSICQMWQETRQLLVTPGFLYGTGIVMAVFFGYMALLGIGSAVTEEAYGLPPTLFGPLFSINALAFVVGAAAATRLASRYGVSAIIRAGAIISLSAGLYLLGLSTVTPGLALLWSGIVIFQLAFGTLLALAIARGLEPAGNIAGTASSVMGFVQTLLSASGAFVAATLFDGSHRSLCWVMGFAAVTIFILWWKGQRYL
jgi:DHA1 family bicyclomycin/chloramphenicol resistance-like MFS transporter